jgi:glycosyltransferase involved in cell wall biosynthesis
LAASDPLVSVVLPTFNRERTVGKAIESVLRQTYTRLELLVIDDASTDGTPELVRRLDDPRISYLRQENNSGGSAARNAGLAAASGELVAFQDSDDEWLAHKLERQVDLLTRSPDSTGVIYCPYRRIYPDGRSEIHPADPSAAPRGEIHRRLLRGNFIGTPTILARRTCVDSVGGFDEALPRFQDWDWMIRVSKDWQVGVVEEPLVLAGYENDNVTDGHSTALVAAERRLVEKHIDTLREAGADVLAHRLWHLAHVSIMQGSVAEGRRALRRALRTRFRMSWVGAGMLSLVPPLYRATYRWTRGRAGHRR